MTSQFDINLFEGFDREHAASEYAEISIYASRLNVQLSWGDRITQEFLVRDANRETFTKQYSIVRNLVSYAARHGIGYLHIMRIRREEINSSGQVDVYKIVSFAI